MPLDIAIGVQPPPLPSSGTHVASTRMQTLRARVPSSMSSHDEQELQIFLGEAVHRGAVTADGTLKQEPLFLLQLIDAALDGVLNDEAAHLIGQTQATMVNV